MNELLASIVYVYFQETVPKEFEASTEYVDCDLEYRQSCYFSMESSMLKEISL